MKTKQPVRRNFSPTSEEMTIRRAIHILQDATDDEMMLMQREHVYLYGDILLGKDEEPVTVRDQGRLVTTRRVPGTVQYRVLDGPLDDWGTSFDFYTFAEAKKCFQEIAKIGWEKYLEKIKRKN